jgi:hypothetical protein
VTFDKINRRTHLYLGIVLTPWFLMYAFSSVVLNHRQWFQAIYDDGIPAWKVRFEREYSLPTIAEEEDDPYDVAEKILSDTGLQGRHSARFTREGNLEVYRNSFLSTVRLTYYPEKERLVAEDERFRWDRFFTRMHTRGGLNGFSFLDTLWAVMVDLVVVSTFIWIVSGLYIWWKLPRFRFWGWVSLAGGLAGFVALALSL